MASDNEGIAALFSMYKDDDDEEEEAYEPKRSSPAAAAASSPSPETGPENPNPNPNSAPSPAPLSPPLSDEPADRKTLASPGPQQRAAARSPLLPPLPSRRSSSPFLLSSPSPIRPPVPAPIPAAERPRPSRRGALAIVDYAHDEMAMSPDKEDGEIMGDSSGLDLDVHLSEGNLEERTLSGTVHILAPNTQPEWSRHADAPNQNQLDSNVAMDAIRTETEVTQMEEAADVSVHVQNDDPLSCFLPPPVTTKCSAELQQKINRFLLYKKSGKSFNAEVRNRKDYKNPDFLQHAVRYQEIDQIGTCFSKDVFDPYGYDKSDYYDEIEADMKRELERKEQEKKKSQKVDFVGGGIQPGSVAPVLKNPAAVSAAAVAALPQVPVAAEGAQKETRQSKKSKWDKISETRNPAVSAGHDNLSSVTVHAALLNAANVGAGYTAFAQQKRKEAEEKRTSDKKSDRRT